MDKLCKACPMCERRGFVFMLGHDVAFCKAQGVAIGLYDTAECDLSWEDIHRLLEHSKQEVDTLSRELQAEKERAEGLTQLIKMEAGE